MQVDILNIKGAKTGRSIELPAEIFEAEPNEHVIYLAVKQYLAAQRQGTHKVKTRMEVKGSSKKLHKQKGTGGSRKGNIRNPLYKGGGTIFGPKPRSYDFKLNRKVKDLAKISAFSAKAKAGSIVVVEDLKFDGPKTSQAVEMLGALQLGGKKALLILADFDNNIYLSTRNMPHIETTPMIDVNTYDIVNASTLILAESAVKLFHVEEEAATA